MNFKNLTYKQKNRYLLIASILFLLFAYNFVIRKTVDLYFVNQSLHTKITDGLNAPERKRDLENRLDQFNNSLNKYLTDSISKRENILSIVSEFCHKNQLILKEFPEPILHYDKDFEIETNIVIAEGGYINLLKLVYELEQNQSIARPTSVNFEKKFDHKRKKEVLTLTMYLQNIRMTNEKIL
jgi:hypothetical protein